MIDHNPDVSIVLLVKNGERYLKQILDAISFQTSDHNVEVIAIDSGSSDSTLDILSSYPVELIQIPSNEFNHGETRNVGVRSAHSGSQYIVFLSQDAIPYDEHWLEKLIHPLEIDSQVAGAFGRHVPRENASPSLVRQLTMNWQTGGNERFTKAMPKDPQEYERNKMQLIYFSNTSSVVRRAVWEEIPFRPLNFAEDADWADRVLRAGHKLVFEPRSKVIHSHDYGFLEHLRQNADHTMAMIELFDPPNYKSLFIWTKLLLNIPREVWRDWKFQYLSEFHKDSTLIQRIKWLVRSPYWHLASVLGGWIGANMQRVPERMRILFSRQERIRRGTRFP